MKVYGESQDPFLNYSMPSWVHHYAELDKQDTLPIHHDIQTKMQQFLFLDHSSKGSLVFKEWHAVMQHVRRRGEIRALDSLWDIVRSLPNSPIQVASIFGIECLLELVMSRGDVNLNCRFDEALHLAAEYGRLGMVKLLIERGADPDIQDQNRGHTAIVRALNGHYSVPRHTRAQVLDVNHQDDWGLSPLMQASETGFEFAVELLLSRKDIEAGLADTETGQTALLCATANGNARIAKMLLSRPDVHIDCRDERNGMTPLLYACETGLVDVVKEIIESGKVDPTVTDLKGRNAMWWSVRCGNLQTMELLHAQGVNASAVDHYGDTPLLMSFREVPDEWPCKNFIDKMEFLLDICAVDVDARDSDGRTALSLAAGARVWPELIQLLLDKGADASLADHDGHFPLSYACRYGHTENAVSLLSANGVDIDTRDLQVQDALFCAVDGVTIVETVKLLVKEGADVSLRDNLGRTRL
ncbi:ankyrin repeat-containing domain protein [Cladorrhinum sp. PSN332]|nr:ankyrin repeat-containing domain protein [Cladorrhinum sp. PSN332]